MQSLFKHSPQYDELAMGHGARPGRGTALKKLHLGQRAEGWCLSSKERLVGVALHCR
jgi:hypothetical protein